LLKHTTTLPFPVDAVIDELCSEGFMLPAQRAREDVVEAEYEQLDETPEYRRFAVPYTHYRRSKTGRLDPSATERSRTEYELRQPARTLTWKHVGPEDKKVSISGFVRFVELGPESCRIDREISIEIRIPIVGKAVTKVVEAQFRKGLDASDITLRQALTAKRSSP
jgi:hypothetical protein